MLQRIRDILIGSPLPTQHLAHKRLNKIRALAAFSPDALSSVAYANQEIYLGLVVAGAAGLSLAFPIGLAITGLLVLVPSPTSRPSTGTLPGAARTRWRGRTWGRCRA